MWACSLTTKPSKCQYACHHLQQWQQLYKSYSIQLKNLRLHLKPGILSPDEQYQITLSSAELGALWIKQQRGQHYKIKSIPGWVWLPWKVRKWERLNLRIDSYLTMYVVLMVHWKRCKIKSKRMCQIEQLQRRIRESETTRWQAFAIHWGPWWSGLERQRSEPLKYNYSRLQFAE